jgi:hypothetical protein
MAEFVVRLEEQPELELDTLDVGVEEDIIAFDMTGTIRDIDDDLLGELANETLQLTEIHFTTDE